MLYFSDGQESGDLLYLANSSESAMMAADLLTESISPLSDDRDPTWGQHGEQLSEIAK